jgi:hypothetical protein
MASSITQRIANIRRLTISEDAQLLSATKIQVFVTQGSLEFVYDIPVAVSDTEIDVEIPYADAIQLGRGAIKVQVAWTDTGGTPRCTKPKTISVDEFIYSGGYEAYAG